jgi:hypothetical protein
VSTEEELLEQLKQLKVDDVLLNTVVTLVNLSAHKLQDKDLDEAKKGIDAAREMLALCPQEQAAPIKEALSQLQMAWVRERQGPGEEPAQDTLPEEPQKPKPDIWTPGSGS